MKSKELMQKLEEARGMLLRSIEGLTEEEMTQEILKKEWTIKDTLGHIASWEREEREMIRKALGEEEPGFDYSIQNKQDLDLWNKKEVERKRSLSLEEIQRELEEEHLLFLQLVGSLSDDDLKKEFQPPWPGRTTIEECVLAQIEHELEHRARILEWREKRR